MKETPSSTVQVETRRLAAIMFTDIVDFSRQMGTDEARTLRLLETHNQIIQQAVAAHHGTVIKTVGDAFLVDFPSVVHAVQCAQSIQAQFRTRNAEKEPTEQIHVRIGIHLGDIVQKDGDVFGDGVNIAARLQGLAEPDTICISDVVYRDVSQKVALGTVVSLGRPQLKNITQRFQVYALLPEPPKGLRQTLRIQFLKLSRRLRLVHYVGAVGLFFIAGTFLTTRYFLAPPPNTHHASRNTQESLPLPDKPSIVVLPFDNMSKDPEQDYFSNSITEVLTSDLSRISSLFVIARNTAFTYKGKAINVQEVGKELGVRYVLEGSVQRAGDQVCIVAQLIDTPTGSHIWSERYDRPLKDIFALQDEIVKKIVTTLKLQLTLREQGVLMRKTTDNLEAYDYVLRGADYFLRLTNEANAQARQMYEKAIALDLQYGAAHALLGWTYYVDWGFYWNRDLQTLERALALAQRALALDDSLPVASALLGIVYTRKQQYDQAIAESERTIALDPNNANSYVWLAEVLIPTGRAEEALRKVQQGMRLNPRPPPFYLFTLGWAYRATGRYTEAVATLKEALSRHPNQLYGLVNLAGSYVAQWAFQQSADPQTLEQALAAAQRVIAMSDAFPWGHATLADIYQLQKQYELALAESERAVALAPNEAESYAILADVLSCIGRSEEALRMVEQALRRRSGAIDGHLARVGSAYYLAGRPEEALVSLRQFLSHYPHFLGSHLILAAVYSELGKETEARAEAVEVLRINPKFSLEVHKERVPIKDPATLERHIAALRKAGLK